MAKYRQKSYICIVNSWLMNKVEIPKYLLRLDFMLKSLAFIVVFSVMFMIVYTPFSLTAWFDIFDRQHLWATVSFYLSAIAFMVFSKVVMAWAQNRIAITASIYALWLVGEIIAISLLYAGFTELAVNGMEPHDVWYMTVRAFCCVTAILVIPYVILGLYAAYKSKKEEFDVMRHGAKPADGGADSPRLINFYDSNGVMRLTVDIDSLYYMESQDNYVKIYYENEDSLHYYMLRSRTKSVEESLANTSMVRCHRSYIINASKIKLLIPDKTNCRVVLRHDSIKAIPVSKSYCDNLMRVVESGRFSEA